MSDSRSTHGRARWLHGVLGFVVLMLFAAAAGMHERAAAYAPPGGATASESVNRGARPAGAFAFVRSRENSVEIRLGVAGGATRRLTLNRHGYDEDPAWSPDGSMIAFARSVDRGKTIGIYVMSATGRGIRRVSPRRGIFAGQPSWSPDGRWIAFTGSGGAFGDCKGDAFRVRPDGTGFRRLARNARAPVWSPDGKRLAVVRLDRQERPWIYVGTGSGTALRRLTAGAHPTWSPDGRSLAFARVHRGVNQIFVIGANGRELRQLTAGNTFELDPAWSPNGKWIAYWAVRGRTQSIYASPVAHGPDVRLTRAPVNAGDQEPAWRPGVAAAQGA